LLATGCTTTTEEEERDAVLVQAVEGTAENITVEVYSDGWGDLLETFTLATEGPLTLDIYEEEPYSSPAEYYAFARAPGFFTELYHCTQGQSIDVDLDAVGDGSSAVAGTIFARQSFFSDRYVADQLIEVSGPEGFQTTFTTDSQGRYGLQQLPTGTYTFEFDYQQFGDEPATTFTLSVENASEGVDYRDLSFAEPAQAS